jgi:DNA N-6-adenine-methyltransferase (Dam)/Protein of unknown function (DUF3102)
MKTLPVLIRKINEGHKLVGSSVDRACEVGKWLIEAKKQVQHGQWRSWQKKNLKFAIRTAQVYMLIAEREAVWRPKTQHDAYLSLRGALALITQPKGMNDGRHHSQKKNGAVTLSAAWNSSSTKSQDEFLQRFDLHRFPIAVDGDGNTIRGKFGSWNTLKAGKPCGYDSDAWGSPKVIIESTRQLFGTIELDPASSAKDQLRVKAKRYFTKKDNSLTKQWNAKTVYLNYPYGDTITWINKVLNEFESGRAKEVIVEPVSEICTGR